MSKYLIHILSALATILIALGVAGCNQKKETPLFSGPAETPPAEILKKPFKDIVEPRLFELPSQALAEWRNYAKYKPALILYSNHPFLTPVPENRRKEVHQLLSSGTSDEIERRFTLHSANPLLGPSEAVSAAIDNGIFSELFLVLPNREPVEKISAEAFGKSAVAAGFLTEAEADSLTLADGVIQGTLRGIPLHVLHPSIVAKIDRPAIVHIDLGYFNGMYVNDVKTPVYDLLYQTATQIGNAGYPVIAFTLSYSNQDKNFSLESRFLIRDFAEMLRQPKLLDGEVPASWGYRAQAFYLSTMFMESESKELIRGAAEASPDDPAALYALALLQLRENQPQEGFETLDRAVALDKGYALAYLELADRGEELGATDTTVTLLEKAAKALPDDPFVRIRLAEKLLQIGRKQDAQPLLAELRKLPWSPDFHPGIPQILEQMALAAEAPDAPAQPQEMAPPATEPFPHRP